MTKAIAHTYTYLKDYRSIGIAILLSGCLLFALVYAYSVYRAVSLAVSMQYVQKEIRTVDAAIGALDGRYIAISGKITPDSLNTFGFNKGTVSSYISRTSAQDSVALADHEF